MKTQRGKGLLALGLAVIVPVGLFINQASIAADGQPPALIDKEFETALRKFVARRFYRRINATDEQKQKIDTIWNGTAESTRADREQLRKGMWELSDLMAGDAATDEQITQKAHELRALHEKINDQRLESILKARKVLTAEQRTKIQNRLKDRLSGGGGGLLQRRIGMLPGFLAANDDE